MLKLLINNNTFISVLKSAFRIISGTQHVLFYLCILVLLLLFHLWIFSHCIFSVLNLIMEIELMVWLSCFSNTNARLRDTSWGNFLTLFESTKLTYNTHNIFCSAKNILKKKITFLLEVTAVLYKEKLSYSSWKKLTKIPKQWFDRNLSWMAV